MTIRAKLTLWYAGMLFLSTVLIGGLSYYELTTELRQVRREAGQRQGRETGETQVRDEEVEEEEEEVEEQLQGLLHLLGSVGWIGAPAAALALGGGWLLMRKSLAPVAALTAAAAGIHDGNLDTELPRSGNGDELDRLTEVLNAMTSRLHNAFQRIREFTLHASHELQTPLTIMHGELETELRDDDLSPAQKERILSQLDEIQRLSQIVNGLTLLTKADAGQVALVREPVRLDELVREAYEDAQILAEPTQVQVQLGRCDPITVCGDRHRLRQLLLNLTDNAIKYNQVSGNVLMELTGQADQAEITISNTGPGLPPERAKRAFDRFFRGDPAHGNAIEGCGLGLSIAQWIVRAHGGTIRLTSAPGQLTTATVRLPIEPEPEPGRG